MEHLLKNPVNFINSLINFFQSKEEDTTNFFDITIPNNVLHRTELICKFISTEKGYDFDIDNFLMLLYLDFIKNAVKNYNPKKIYTLLTKEHYKSNTLILESGDEYYEIDTREYDFTTLTLSMEEDDVAKGELILHEIYDLYRVRISFNRLLESLWIGFIEGYKLGDNNKCFQTIVKLLENCFK